MRVLLVKTSSMGDVVHSLPAVTDATNALPGLQLDWVVEESFASIPERHPGVAQVIPCALRRWRQSPWSTWRSGEWKRFRQQLQAGEYDCVIDAQGLIKSAVITRMVRGPKVGLDRESAREPMSARVLDRPVSVARNQHAVTRVRQLFSRALGYAMPDGLPDYGLVSNQQCRSLGPGAKLVFFHGTTWATKHWPEFYWAELTGLALQAGCQVHLPWGSEQEHQRAQRIAANRDGVTVMQRQGLSGLMDSLSAMDGFVAVDTGLAHLAAAMALPGVALYGPTDPVLTGVLGAHAVSVAADFACAPCVQERCRYKGGEDGQIAPPCFGRLPPERVWQSLMEKMG